MKEITEDKGRVRPVVEGDFQCDENGNSTRVYEILSIVGIVDNVGKLSYISKKNVPIGIPITDEEYWYPFQVIAVPKGDKGDDGKSAYDLYIEHGGTITPVEEWLESLHGADGKDAISPILRISPDGLSIEISSDNGQTWLPFQKDFNKLRVLGYVESVAQLPVSANIGDIYGVWNQQAQSGAGAYELYINTVKDWTLEYTITKVYDYDTELPSSATDGTTVLVPVTDLTLDKEKVDGYKIYKFSLANNGWVMILNTAEIYASKEDIVSHGDNKYALVQGEGRLTETKLRENTVVSKKDYCRIVNMTDNSLMLIIVQDSKRMFHSIGTGAYMLPNNCGVYLVKDSSVTDDIVIAPSMHVSEATHLSDLEYMPEGIYPYYILTESSAGDIYITPESKLTPNESEEQEGLTVETKTTTLLSFKQTYELYKRIVDWVYFGTNASITYHLVQDVNEGTANNVASGKAVKDAVDTANANLDNFKQEVKDTYGDYTENPEFVRVVTDNEDKVLYGVQTDGNFYFGAGCPPQVKEYVQQQIDIIMGQGDITEKIDTINEMIAFFDQISHDENLKNLLDALDDKKVDKEEGKSLIDAEYAEGVHHIENPEFAEVKVDNEGRILEAIMEDGTKILPAGAKVIGTAEYDGATIKTVENPEFVGVWLDGEDKILFGVEQDGNFLFGCGVPRQVKEYIEQKIEELSLDEYESIVNFIGDYLNNTTLEELLSKKVDGEYVDNPEFIEAKTDADDKLIEATKKDGTKAIGGDLNVGGSAKILGNMEVSGVSYKVIKNPEYLAAWVDAIGKVIFGLKVDGKTYVGDADFLDDVESIKAFLANFNNKNIDWDALTSITATENPEFIQVTTDSEDKVLEGITTDGVKKINIPVDNGAAIIESVDNPEFIEAKVDAEGRLIEGINKNGEKIFGVIPPQIKQYIDENMPAGGSGVSSIEYDDATGDMYATYDDESGVTDVYMEPNGDIYVESEE